MNTAAEQTTPATESPAWDVAVYGATPAAVMAAVSAARSGCRVVLLETSCHVGGIMAEGLGASDIDNHKEFRNSSVVSGLALEFYRRVGDAYGRDQPTWAFEPHVAEGIFGDLLQQAGVDVRTGARLNRVGGISIDRGRIRSVRTTDGLDWFARQWIDASIEGDLLEAAGIQSTIGREANSVYGETRNGIRAESTYRQFEVRVDPYIDPGDATSGVIATIQDEPLGTPGAGDHRIQAYCFRLCLTREPANRIPFERPADYEPARYEIYRRYVQAGGKLWTPYAVLPGKKTDLGSWHDLSANLYGMNHAYPGGDDATRERVLAEHASFTRGLCWFLCHDPALPSSLRATWSEWGVCRDEFQDNDGWPRRFYVRDARRMVGEVIVTEHHTRPGGADFADPIAVAWWPPDVHHVRRIVRDGAAYNEGFVFGGHDWRPFGIPLRAIRPRREQCTNLTTPTCISASHIAHGAIRIEWTYMTLGQAAGVVAALALQADSDVQDVPYLAVQRRLSTDGVRLSAEDR